MCKKTFPITHTIKMLVSNLQKGFVLIMGSSNLSHAILAD